jgi:hypothetical protein
MNIEQAETKVKIMSEIQEKLPACVCGSGFHIAGFCVKCKAGICIRCTIETEKFSFHCKKCVAVEREENLKKMREEFKKTGVCPLECDDGQLTYSTIGWSVDMENYERTIDCPVCNESEEYLPDSLFQK